MTNEEILAALAGEGVVEADVHFSGGGDSGGVDRIEFVYADGSEKESEPSRTFSHLSDPLVGRIAFLNPALKPFARAIEFMEQPVEDRYCFNNDPYVDGTINYDVTERRVTLKVSERYTEYSEAEDGNDEYEEESTRTEYIEEVLYQEEG